MLKKNNVQIGGNMTIRLLGVAIMLALAMPVTNAQNLELEEVVVTARKRTENLLDVPLSITAVTQDDIERSGIDSIQDVADHVVTMVYFMFREA